MNLAGPRGTRGSGTHTVPGMELMRQVISAV